MRFWSLFRIYFVHATILQSSIQSIRWDFIFWFILARSIAGKNLIRLKCDQMIKSLKSISIHMIWHSRWSKLPAITLSIHIAEKIFGIWNTRTPNVQCAWNMLVPKKFTYVEYIKYNISKLRLVYVMRWTWYNFNQCNYRNLHIGLTHTHLLINFY